MESSDEDRGSPLFYARDAKRTVWGGTASETILMVDGEPDAAVFRRLRDLAHEEEKVFAQALDRDVAVFVELLQEK